MKGNGFNKLRASTVAGVLGLGLLGVGGSARAVTTATPLHIRSTSGSRVYFWGDYNPFGPTSSGTAISNMTWAFNPAITTAWVSEGAFAISDGGLATPSGSSPILGDYYDSAFQFAVDGTAYTDPDGIVDLTGNVITTDEANLSGLQSHVQLAFGVGRPGVLRALYSFRNTSASPISATIAIGGNLGSDSSTTVQATQDGDTVIEATDAWYVSNDNTTLDGEPLYDPNFTLCRFGTDAGIMPVSTSVPGTTDGMGYTDSFVENYSITVPAGGTTRIMLINEMTETLAAGKAAGPDCATIDAASSAGFLAGLTQQEVNEIANYGSGVIVNPDEGAVAVPTMGAISLVWLSGVLGLFGLASLRRSKQTR